MDFISPFIPSTRSGGHIDELGFLTEILRTVTWNVDTPNLAICGIADNSSSNMRYRKGGAKRGEGLQLTRTFRRWLHEQKFGMHSFYFRPGHNMAADFLTRASLIEIESWASEHQMTRIDPRSSRATFCAAILPIGRNGIYRAPPTCTRGVLGGCMATRRIQCLRSQPVVRFVLFLVRPTPRPH